MPHALARRGHHVDVEVAFDPGHGSAEALRASDRADQPHEALLEVRAGEGQSAVVHVRHLRDDLDGLAEVVAVLLDLGDHVDFLLGQVPVAGDEVVLVFHAALLYGVSCAARGVSHCFLQ